jgi:hypothetical protein
MNRTTCVTRPWQVLLIGGASGAGKTSVSYGLAHHFNVGITEVDDFHIILKRMTTPELGICFAAGVQALNALHIGVSKASPTWCVRGPPWPRFAQSAAGTRPAGGSARLRSPAGPMRTCCRPNRPGAGASRSINRGCWVGVEIPINQRREVAIGLNTASDGSVLSPETRAALTRQCPAIARKRGWQPSEARRDLSSHRDLKSPRNEQSPWADCLSRESDAQLDAHETVKDWKRLVNIRLRRAGYSTDYSITISIK